MNGHGRITPIGRRGFLAGTLGAGALALGATGCSAIGGEAGAGAGAAGSGSDQAASLPAPGAGTELSIQPYARAEVDGMADVYLEAPTDLVRSVDREPGDGSLTVSTFQLMWGTPPVERAKNEYWQELETRLGVTFEPQFVPAATFDAKFSTMLASGDVPDLVFLNDQSPAQLQGIRDGAFADLSDVLGGDGISAWPNLATRSEDIWRSSLKGGRIFQIPSTVPRITNHTVMRRDLFEETSIGPEPADADQLLTALTEISALSRDGQKMYGFTNVDVNRTLFQRMFRVGAEWQRDASGKLVHMIETANYKEMITWLAAAWKAGVFDPNSLTPEADSTAWRSGLSYEAVSGTFGGPLFADAAELHPGTQLDFFTLPGFDGTSPLIIQNIPYGRSTAISAATAADEDRLHQVLDVLDYLSAPWGSEEQRFVSSGIEGRHWEAGELGIPVGIEEHADELGVQYVAVESGRPRYSATPKAVDLAESFTAHLTATAQASEARLLEGLESDSTTFVAKGPQLKQSYLDFENGVITGRTPVGDLDSFISSYLSQGGEQVRSEYQALLDEDGR